MALLIKDTIELAIYFGDTEYDIGAVNMLSYLYIGVSQLVRLPTMQFHVVDASRKLEKYLTDGAQMTVTIKPYSAKAVTLPFRKFNHYPAPDESGATAFTVEAYLDFPKYFMACASDIYTGSASSVLEQIASTCGMTPDTVPTADNMTWFQGNKTYSRFADEVSARAYISDSSCMALSTDVDGSLRLRDLSNLGSRAATHNVVARGVATNSLIATAYLAEAVSGLHNSLTGYNNGRVTQSIVDGVSVINKVPYTPDTKNPFFNQDMKKYTDKGPTRFAPIDSGNVHSNYEKAHYQNVRQRNLYTSKLTVQLASPSSIQIFDKINFTSVDQSYEKDKALFGEYIVTGRGFGVQDSIFSEKIECYRKGNNVT